MRENHRQGTKYTYYAKRPRRRHEPNRGDLRFTALNEEQHAKILVKLLNDGIGSTEENLKNAAEGEHFEWAEMYADFAKTAEEEGFANIARLFSGVAAIEKSHEQRFLTLERSVREGGVFQSGEETTVWICRNCGHIAVGKTAPQVCRCAATRRRTSSAGRKTTDVRRRAHRSGARAAHSKAEGQP